MPLSISSSERSVKSWLAIFGGLLALSALTILGYNYHWTGREYSAAVQDTKQFWAVHRAQVYPRGKKALVFLGASRTLYGIDLDWVRNNLTEYQPVMLAVNGHYPLAMLKDLAQDSGFSGAVFIDIDSRGLNKNNHAMLQPYVDYYHNEFSPNKWAHHWILARLQQKFIFLGQEFSLLSSLERILNSSAPPRIPNSWMDTHRNNQLDLTMVDADALANWFAGLVESDMQSNPPAAPEQWLEDLAEVKVWVDAIEQRGGRVVFYSPPVSGRQFELEQKYYPRSQYWDAFVQHYKVTGLNTMDIPAIRKIELPDESHMNYWDKSTYTELLMNYFVHEVLK